MKTFKRILTLILALLMLSAVFISCSGEKDGDKTDGKETADDTASPSATESNADVTEQTTAGDAVTEEPGKTEAEGCLLDDLPDDIDYKGKEITVLHWNAEREEFDSDGFNGDNVTDAIHERNINIQERLGVKLIFEECLGSNKYREDFVNTVSKSFSSGEQAYDIIATYSRTAALCTIKGFFSDLNAIEDSYIDFDKPWWPSSLTDTVEVGNSLYYLSGDASTNLLHMMYTVYYNKELLEDLGLEDPTVYVDNHTWTIDKLVEMSSNRYVDLDGNGKSSAGDFFGFSSRWFDLDAFYTGSGLRLVEKTNDDELLKISNDFYSQKTDKLVSKLGKWLTTDDCLISVDNNKKDCEKPFVDGRLLFMQNRVHVADNRHPCKLNAVEWKYGLVPTPLFDENQQEYITLIANPFTLYGIMEDCRDKTCMTAVLECWGSEAYRHTTPQIFEINMKYKYTVLDTSVRMFDILHDTVSFDQGRLFGNILGPYISELPSNAAANGSSWPVIVRAHKKKLENQMKQIADSFRSIQG